MATTYRQVAHGQASFQFANDSAVAVPAGTRLKVGGLLFYTKHTVPGYDKTGAVGENKKIWEGEAYLLHFGSGNILEATLDAPLGADYTFGEALTLDGEFVGYAIPHPGEHHGSQGHETAMHLDGSQVVARSSDRTVRFIGLPPIGSVTTNPVVGQTAAFAGTITPSSTAATIATQLQDAESGAGQPVATFAMNADTSTGNIEGDAILDASQFSAVDVNAVVAITVTGVNELQFTDPVTGTSFSFVRGESLKVRRYPGDTWRVE